jgi:phosphoglycolate phosphatase-like HAD superfamily hydrolase
MGPIHVVWDWNGTLLDDLPHVVDAVSRSVSGYGLPRISVDDYRDHYTRPVRLFYDSLLGRKVDDMEWDDLNKNFHENYYAVVDGISLTEGAMSCLDAVADLGWSQSLLSMSTHDELLRTVRAHRIDGYFDLIQGLHLADGSNKAPHLASHLETLRIEPSRVFVVGDTPDDHHAAVEVGAGSVLFDGGSHHRRELVATGATVVESLADAVDTIQSWVAA